MFCFEKMAVSKMLARWLDTATSKVSRLAIYASVGSSFSVELVFARRFQASWRRVAKTLGPPQSLGTVLRSFLWSPGF